nr:hypothetical protein [Paenibacillus naphthalenovorans]
MPMIPCGYAGMRQRALLNRPLQLCRRCRRQQDIRTARCADLLRGILQLRVIVVGECIYVNQ